MFRQLLVTVGHLSTQEAGKEHVTSLIRTTGGASSLTRLEIDDWWIHPPLEGTV